MLLFFTIDMLPISSVAVVVVDGAILVLAVESIKKRSEDHVKFIYIKCI